MWQTTIDLFQKGGLVMYPLLLSSLVAIVLIVERCLFWWKVARRQQRVVREVLRLYASSKDKAIKKLELELDLPIARIFLTALELDYPDTEEFKIALESAAQAEIPILKRFNTIFDSIITLAPLLGLLGTVTGLMNSFASLRFGDFSGERATVVTGGISEALITTATGLIIAIFTAFFANMFRGFYQRQIYLIQEYGGQLELIFRRYHCKAGVSNNALT
ncbi:MAG: MotA/TolQ/ExbB proton channel family protein [Pseudanabaenaceae cyanobacterium SKYGB_i_bin29]|nr:MotA/TolQ/ExbB proton channel family protein [Pseudanabaenaceae cyanobacterium SKYG29]MDW8421644.1 MotA/TolQ/ExbB proton channel family protein [Pseudanabaenaceae cyanobacterium SKYGB_i_bin29]